MRALVTNDDGIESPGLRALAEAALAAGLKPVVAAPASNHSGVSAAITGGDLDGRITVESRQLPGLPGVPAYAVPASPAHLVLMAMAGAFGQPPAVVLSGINLGPNLSHVVLYSGTVGAALAGVTQGCPALAVSLNADPDADPDEQVLYWDTARTVTARILTALLRGPDRGGAAGLTGVPPIVLNLNVPNTPLSEVVGVRRAALGSINTMGMGVHHNQDGSLALTWEPTGATAERGSDEELLLDGYATVTPLTSISEARDVVLPDLAPVPATYEVRTYGCQMNAHDSERISGLLDQAGYRPVVPGQNPDLLVFNTCAIRENADNRLYGNLGHLRPVKDANPGMRIAVGGCLAQKDRHEIVRRAPWVDVVFGTHNLHALPVLLERARHNQSAQIEIAESLEVFPSCLPSRRESRYAGWVSISVGCDNTCTYCIVPTVRGRQLDRRPDDVLAEVRTLAEDGVLEVTLLGQNVNSYGHQIGDRTAFSSLLRACGRIDGLERVRFTSPHPKDFTDDVIEAMAQTPNVCHQLHLPLQSGSDQVLKAMRRSYRVERYLGIVDRVRAALPDAAITTDLIVGFPGETEADFTATLDVVRRARFAGAFTFQYSKRPGTPAATSADQVPKEVVQERYDRLVSTVEEISLAENQALVGRRVEVLVAVGEGRKDDETGRRSGRARDGRLVHFRAGPGAAIRPGDVIETTITYAAPHHLTADGVPHTHRRTAAGDAWSAP